MTAAAATLPRRRLHRALGKQTMRSMQHPAIPVGRRHGDDNERVLVAALRRGEEDAFVELVERYGGSLLRLARTFVRDRTVAEEVVQETWLAVLNGVDRFEGRSSLKTWIFQILRNRAKTRAVSEHRCAPFSALVTDGSEDDEAAVDADRFRGDGHRWAGHWAAAPSDWSALPEERLLSSETLAQVHAAIDALPPRQAEVLVLRDVEGWSPEEVCAALGISDGNQRILLHRARSKVQGAVADYLAEGMTP
jgi:RNA polymerase sigma-70 factor (ECF subfamily)